MSTLINYGTTTGGRSTVGSVPCTRTYQDSKKKERFPRESRSNIDALGLVVRHDSCANLIGMSTYPSVQEDAENVVAASLTPRNDVGYPRSRRSCSPRRASSFRRQLVRVNEGIQLELVKDNRHQNRNRLGIKWRLTH